MTIDRQKIGLLLSALTLLELAQPISATTVPPCQAATLTANFQGWNTDPEGLGGSIYIKNNSSSACSLFTSGRLQIMDSSGQVLPVQHLLTSGFWASPIPERLVLKPKSLLVGLVVWQNWCRPAPKSNLSLRMTLPSNRGRLTMPIRDRKGFPVRTIPRCNHPNNPSFLMMQYLVDSKST